MFRMEAFPAVVAAAIASVKRPMARLKTLSRVISVPYVIDLSRLIVEIAIVQKPSPSSTYEYPAYAAAIAIRLIRFGDPGPAATSSSVQLFSRARRFSFDERAICSGV